MTETTTFVGLDAHEEGVAVAVADGGIRSEARYLGAIANQPAAIWKLAERLARKVRKLRFRCEPGP